MADLRVLGIDLALTATGIAEPDGTLRTFKPYSYTRGMARLAVIRDHILHAAIYDLDQPVDLVVIEGYAYAAKQSAHQLGELGGVVRLALWERGTPYVNVPPSTLKRYACGRGNAPKDEVLVAAVKRLGADPTDNNQADAAWLRAMALDHYGHPPAAMPAKHREALDSVAWLELPGGAR